MNNLTKRILIGVLIAATAFSFSLSLVQGEEVYEEVDDLEQLADDLNMSTEELQEELDIDFTPQVSEEETDTDDSSTGTYGHIDGIPTDFIFTRNLSRGMREDSIEYLQMLLNTDPDTKLADYGAGSPGSETNYFGPRTQDALIRFQEKYASEVLHPQGRSSGTGFVGEATRDKLNELLTEEDYTTDPDSDPEDVELVLERLEELTSSLESLRTRIDELEDGSPTDPIEDGEEGLLYLDQLHRPRINSMNQGEKDVEVMGVELEAEDSDINIRRVDLDLEGWEEKDGNGKRIRTLLKDVSLWIDGQKIAERRVDRDNVGSDDYETLRFNDIDIDVQEDSTEDLVVRASAESYVEGYVEMSFNSQDSFRYLDELNINQTTGVEAREDFSIYDSDYVSEEVEIESTDEIEEGIVTVEEKELNEIEMLEFTVEAEEDIFLEVLDVEFTGQSDGNYVDYLTLQDAEGVLDSVDVDGSGNYEFLPEIELDGDETHTFRLVAETQDIFREEQGEKIQAEITDAIALDRDDYEMGLDIDAQGEELAVYIVRPEFNFQDSDLNVFGDDENQADGFIEFEMEAAGGGLKLDYIDFSNTGSGNFQAPLIIYDGEEYEDLDSDGLIDLSDIEEMSEGETVEIVLEGLIEGASSRERMKVNEIGWLVQDEAGYEGFIYDFQFNDDYDFIDQLETPREWLNSL